MTELRKRFMRDMSISNFSNNTIRNYTEAVSKLARHYKKCPSQITEEEIRDFLKVVLDENKSWSHVNIIQSALKLLYTKTLDQSYKVDRLQRPKAEKTLKYILSQAEVVRLLDLCKNVKHKLIFMVMYATGLRVSEVAALKLTDIDSARMIIQVRNPKGHKQREVKMPSELLVWLRIYYQKYKPALYLFEGADKKSHLSHRTIQTIFKQRILAAGIKKPVSSHDLRHTHTTHCLEEGSDLQAVQRNLGHSNIKTTLTYYHLTNRLKTTLISPLETLPGYGTRCQ
ncbi:MAG: site-specific integrase [Saprospiraceae bacterium]|nr:site-specific integrase [Saprospiraceae bacterium]MBK7524229.1 site-specific integrase [Saprospiraceae bacterium]MBK8081147.1 site-specific integrase [Saprospiraceae bacterium]MBK8372851.1 site-specific integrase [Saprospiraceae bacterium]MBK8549016.1 site-specific integrase [Saprospiraceae bacterium]